VSQPVVTEPQTTDPAATVTEPVTTEPAKTEPSGNTNTAVKEPNPVKISVTAKTVSAKKLKKKAQKIKPLTVKNSKGKIIYTLIKKRSATKLFKKAKINSKGFITIKKGKYTKKTYKLKLRITVKGTQKYKPKTITKTVRIRIK
jgi:endo-1,4-beta-xylanase